MNRYMIYFVLALLLVSFSKAQQKVSVSDSDDNKEVIIKKIDPMIDPLNLTDEQKQQFRKLDLELKKEILPLRNELDIKQMERDIELQGNDPNLQKLNNLIEDIHDLQANIEKKELAAEFKKRDLLNEEQRKKWHPSFGHNIEKKVIIRNGDDREEMMWFQGNAGQKHIEEDIKIIK